MGRRIILQGCGLIPTNGLLHVGALAKALLVQLTQEELGLGILFFGGSTKPMGGFGRIAGRRRTLKQQASEVPGGGDIALIGGAAVPMERA